MTSSQHRLLLYSHPYFVRDSDALLQYLPVYHYASVNCVVCELMYIGIVGTFVMNFGTRVSENNELDVIQRAVLLIVTSRAKHS